MMKAQTGEGTGTFHMENFRRRSRYAAVFAVLAAATFCNSDIKHQYRNDKHSGLTYPEDHFPAGRCTDRIQYYLEDPNAASSDGGDPGRCTVPFRISVTDLF